MSQYTRRVQANGDDGSKYVPDSEWNGDYMRMGTDVIAAFRFTSVTVPKGSVITSSYLKAVTYFNIYTTPNLKIAGIDEDNTATMTSDPTGRTKTTAQIDWDISGDPAEDTVLTSPDIKTIVQEIIDRASWASGNAMGFIISNDGGSEFDTEWFYDYSDDPTKAFYIEINYVAPSASPSKSPSRSPSISPSWSPSIGASASPSVSPSRSLSPSKSPSVSPSVSLSPSPSPSLSPSVSPSPSPEDFGIKVVKPTKDVNTETDLKNMIFTSARGILGLKQLTSYTKTTDANGNISSTDAHSIGYVPVVIVSFTAYDGKEVLLPIEWHSIYLNGSRETLEVTETVSFTIDATNIYFTVHAEEYNYDLDTTTNISGRDYTFKVYYYFNEITENY
jgi:hypothetical protein